jgi:hypothetical protein
MTSAIELARIYECEQTSRIGEVSRALIASEARAKRLEEALRKLRAFALDMMGEWPEACDRDGFDIQETAARHGLLQRQDPPPTEPCAEDCACASYYPPEDFKDGGVVCYRKTDLIALREGGRE